MDLKKRWLDRSFFLGLWAHKAVCYTRGLGFFSVFVVWAFALFCFCFLQKGILDSKSVVLCKNLRI